MKQKIKPLLYFVGPKEKFSNSKRWIVDAAGLAVVKERYSVYKKDPLNPINRWHEFKKEKLFQFHIDLGGMCHLKEPEISFQVDYTKFTIKVTHMPEFVGILESPQCKRSNGLWGCGIWHEGWYLSYETVDKFLKVVKPLESLTEEMNEGYRRSMQKEIDEIQRQGMLLQRKRLI